MEKNGELTFYSTAGENGADMDFTFSYDGSKWSENSGAKWEDVEFPFHIYSLNDGTTAGNLVLTPNGDEATTPTTKDTNGDVIACSYYVKETPTTDQEDLIYYGATIAAIPTDGVITATYKHALSKVKMQYQASSSSHTSSNPLLLYITQVKLQQFHGGGNATISTKDNINNITWSNEGSKRNSTIEYYKAKNVVVSQVPAADGTTTIGFDFTNNCDVSYAENLYLMPQTTNAYTKTTNTNIKTSSDVTTYIEVVYRSTDYDGNNILGYAKASQHPQYDSTDNDWITIEDDPLYVMVAIPVSGVTLAPGVYYNFVLDFDGSAIEIAQAGFCDEDGAQITVPSITFPSPSVGGDINPDSSTDITLEINVLDWSKTTTDTTL